MNPFFCFFRFAVLLSLLLSGFPIRPSTQSPQAAQAGSPPAGVSPEAWQNILSQVQADMLSTSTDPLLTTGVKKLTASDGASNDAYGISVAVSGDTAVIGAYHATVGGNLQRGAVYIYQRNRGGAPDHWGEVTKLAAYDGQAYDYFGVSVSISEDTLVVGATGADMGLNSNQGAAYVYRRNAGGADQWGLMKKLVAFDGAAYDYFGGAVTVSGWRLAVGASSADISGRTNQGAVYVFDRNQGGMDLWGTVQKVIATDGAANDYFGGAVALSGNTLVAGAWGAAVSGLLGQGAAYVFKHNGSTYLPWAQMKKLTSLDGAAYDRFGYAVALDAQADTLLVGATDADVDGAANRGAAYVFMRNAGGSADNWGQVQKLAASDGAAGDQFGRSLAVNRNRVLVGAVGDDASRGAVYRYEVNQGGLNQWGQVEKLVAWDGVASDNLGLSVSLNETGDIAILCAPGDDSWRGAGYVFSWQGGDWREQGKLAQGLEFDHFGNSIAISGDILVIGAPYADVSGQTNAGVAYVFALNWGGADQWGLVKKLTTSDYEADDYFGGAVAISADIIVVGALCVDIYDKTNAGAAYIFYRNSGGADQWGQVKRLTASDYEAEDYFGGAVAISADTIVVGAKGADVFGQTDAGAAYVFARNWDGADQWGQVKQLTASDYGSYGYFGNAVAFNAGTIVVGVKWVGGNDHFNAGAAYVFYRNWGGADQWGQVKQLTASDYAVGDLFGNSIAISADTIVVGAPYADVFDQDDAGAAYVFYRNLGGADQWGLVKKLTASDYARFDNYGVSVSISEDTIVVGVPYADVFGLDLTGAAYVFYRNWGGADHWGQVKKLTASNCASGDNFGISVAISADIIVVGASNADVSGQTNTGAAYVFEATNHEIFLPLLLRQ